MSVRIGSISKEWKPVAIIGATETQYEEEELKTPFRWMTSFSLFPLACRSLLETESWLQSTPLFLLRIISFLQSGSPKLIVYPGCDNYRVTVLNSESCTTDKQTQWKTTKLDLSYDVPCWSWRRMEIDSGTLGIYYASPSRRCIGYIEWLNACVLINLRTNTGLLLDFHQLLFILPCLFPFLLIGLQ